MLDVVAAAVERGAAPQWVTDEEETRLNDSMAAEAEARPVEEVLADFRASSARLLEAVRSLSEEELLQPDRYGWLNGRPLWRYIHDESSGEHRHEHLRPFFADIDTLGLNV
jgi:hypothetical protein